MAITRAQQYRQMLEDGGMLVKPGNGKRPGYRSAKAQEVQGRTKASTTKPGTIPEFVQDEKKVQLEGRAAWDPWVDNWTPP